MYSDPEKLVTLSFAHMNAITTLDQKGPASDQKKCLRPAVLSPQGRKSPPLKRHGLLCSSEQLQTEAICPIREPSRSFISFKMKQVRIGFFYGRPKLGRRICPVVTHHFMMHSRIHSPCMETRKNPNPSKKEWSFFGLKPPQFSRTAAN